MSIPTDTLVEPRTRETKQHILSLLEDLPAESLVVVEQFVQFVHQQAEQGQPVVTQSEPTKQPPYMYPTVLVPATSLLALTNLIPEGYEGDALTDSEAIYDDV